MTVPGVVVYSVERNFPGLHRPYPHATPCGCYASSVYMAVKSNISGISTDVVLFSEHGAQLVNHYRVFGDCVAHASLRGSFMIDLLFFTNRACAEAQWVTKRSRYVIRGGVRHSIDQVDRTVLLHATSRTMIYICGGGGIRG